MAHSGKFDGHGDSLDRVERLMALEEAFFDLIHADASLTARERETLTRELEALAEKR